MTDEEQIIRNAWVNLGEEFKRRVKNGERIYSTTPSPVYITPQLDPPKLSSLDDHIQFQSGPFNTVVGKLGQVRVLV